MPLRLKYFVLKPEGSSPYAAASRKAMLTYAAAIADHDPDLAQDLGDWVNMVTWKERGDADGKNNPS